MRPFDDPASLSPDDRLTELALLFAAAVLRLSARAALPEAQGSDPGSTCLEVPRPTVLSDHVG